MLKNKIMHRDKKNIAIVKVCFQSHVNVRKFYLPYICFSFELLLFFNTSGKYPKKILWKALQARRLT